MDVVTEFLDAIPGAAERLTGWGEVTVDDPLTVQLAGDTAGTVVALRDGSYTPSVGDRVWLVKVGARWLVAGKVV